MKTLTRRTSGAAEYRFRAPAICYMAIALGVCSIVAGCAIAEFGSGSDHPRGPILAAPANFDTALQQNKTALASGKSAQDLALFNIGVILAHPANPRRDQAAAMHSFRVLVSEHPRSTYAEQARTWIQVLEQQQKLTEERHRLAEEKRALAREREMLVQERQKLHYASEKSQQLDMEIEKRRRQSLGR